MSTIPEPTVPIPESFQLDSGLREDMILSVHSAYFAPHADYQDGKVLMLWLLGTDENDEPVEVRMSIGSDWQTDDGNVVTHPTKRKQQINKTSIYGFWLQYCWGIPALARIVIDRGEALGAGSRDARIWNDLIIQLENRELSWGRGLDPQERLMPVGFLGLTTDQPTQAALTPIQPPATVTPMPDPAAVVEQARQAAQQQQQASAVTNGSPLFAKAIELAKSSADYASFVQAALGDPEILADDELAMQCADQNQVWAAAHPS